MKFLEVFWTNWPTRYSKSTDKWEKKLKYSKSEKAGWSLRNWGIRWRQNILFPKPRMNKLRVKDSLIFLVFRQDLRIRAPILGCRIGQKIKCERGWIAMKRKLEENWENLNTDILFWSTKNDSLMLIKRFLSVELLPDINKVVNS